MNKLKLLLPILVISGAHSLTAGDPCAEDERDKASSTQCKNKSACPRDLEDDDWFGWGSMRQMHKRMLKFHQQMLEDMESMMNQSVTHQTTRIPTPEVSIKEDDTHVFISVTHLQLPKDVGEKIDLRVRGNTLRVNLANDDWTMDMRIEPRTLTVISELTRDNKNNNHVFGTSRMLRTLPAKVDLRNASATYDDKTGTLTISLQKSADEIEQRIPVTIAP